MSLNLKKCINRRLSLIDENAGMQKMLYGSYMIYVKEINNDKKSKLTFQEYLELCKEFYNLSVKEKEVTE